MAAIFWPAAGLVKRLSYSAVAIFRLTEGSPVSNMAGDGIVSLEREQQMNPRTSFDTDFADKRLHGDETLVLGDRGYHPKHRTIKQFEKEDGVSILRPTKKPAGGELTEEQKVVDRMLSAVRAIVEHPFRVVKKQFCLVTVRYRGLKKNTGADRGNVCAGQSVAGAQTVVALAGRGVPVKREVGDQALDFHDQRSNFAKFPSFPW